MNRTGNIAGNLLPRWIFLSAMFITILLYTLVGLYVWHSKTETDLAERRIFRQEELNGTIKYLDEVLTLSTHMASATGKEEWESRYHNYEPTLDTALAEAMKLSTGTRYQATIIELQSVNQHLVQIEHRAFDQVHRGNLAGASSILNSREYIDNKRKFNEKLSQIGPALQQEVIAVAGIEKHHTLIIIVLSIFSLVTLLFTWRQVRHLVNDSLDKLLTAQTALSTSEAELRALFNSMNDVILVFDKSGRYIKIAPTNPSLLFKPPDVLLGKTLQEVFPPDEAEFFSKSISKTLETGETHNIEYRLEINGKDVWFSAALSPMTDDSVILVARDITEKRHAEEILKESEAKFRTVSETVTSAIFIYQDDKFHYVNRGTEIISGYSQDELLRMKFWDFVHPDFQTMVKNRGLSRQSGDDLPSRYEFKIISKSGEERWLDFTAARIQYQGKPAAIGTAFDITERKRIEHLSSAVYRIAETTNSSPSLNDLFKAVHAIIQEVMPANNFYIALYHEDNESLTFPYFVDEVDIIPPEGPVGKGLTAYVLRTGKSLLCDQQLFDELLKSGDAESVGAPSPIWLGVPLTVENRTIGAMVVQHYSDPKAYTKREQQILEFVSSEVGRAIDRKWAEELLRDSEERYRRLVDLSPDAIAVHVDGKLVFVNHATVTLVGAKSPEDLIGKPVLDLVHPDDRKMVRDRIKTMLDHGNDPPIIEEKFIRIDGTPVDVEVAASPFVYQGKPAIQVVVRNITERKKAAEAVVRSEEKYRDLFANASIGIYQSTYDGKFIAANTTLAKMLGYESVGDLLKRHMAMDIYWDKEERMKLINTYEPVGGASDIEIQWKKKDGSPVWIQLNTHAVKDDTGKTIYFEGFVLDITERKKAQDALQMQTSYYQQLFENSPAGIVVVDGYDNIINANHAFERMFQFSIDEMRGKPVNELIVPESMREEAYELSTISQKGRPVQRETFRSRKDGSFIDVAITGYPIIIDREQVAIYGMYIDITQQKRLEENLRQAQKMESLGTLAGGIAHDFNNLLAIIMGHAALLEQSKGLDHSMQKSTEMITKATQRGAGLVRQLLTFARKSDILLESVQVNETIAEIAKLLAETFPKTITIALHLSNNLPSVIGDANQIHQMLLNLCLNARDAMTKGGMLTITTDIIDAAEIAEQLVGSVTRQYIRVDIADTGVGMDENTRSRIFEPFFTTKERGKGTGLGLATAYGIVESHNGYINVESEPGQGTTFHVYFPIQPRTRDRYEPVKDTIGEVPGGSENILIIEDEEVLRDLLQNILTRHGYSVVTAQDGQEGVDVFIKNRDNIDLVISDLGLPKMGGQEVFGKLREIDPAVKVILASGFMDPTVKTALFKGGAKDFIQKPYAPEEVLKKIRIAIDK